MNVKVSDFIANLVVKAGIRHVFMVTGGGAMHLNHSFGKHPALTCIFNHHEQACAMAAESYARLSRRMALVNVTTGPGGINAMNGVFGAYTDSIPMLVISGQVRYDTTVQSTGLPLRQLGDQEFAGMVECAKTMTKYAVMVTDQNSIQYHLDKAIYLATHGRPGPVWLDIPMNVQGAFLDTSTLYPGFENVLEYEEKPQLSTVFLETIIEKLKDADRPVIYIGTGVRLAGAEILLDNLIERLNIPVVTGFNAHDLITTDHPLFAGRPGSNGDRPGNFAVQNADLILVLGCRLNIRQIGYNWTTFARQAYKIVVDIDDKELRKPTVHVDLPVHADVYAFIECMLEKITAPFAAKKEWLARCQFWRNRYPVVLPEYWERQYYVNPYCFVDELFRHLDKDDVVVCGNATACVCTYQAAFIRKGQRIYSNSGSASMGYDLPAAIGATIAEPGRRVICLAGDGSIQMNLQELQTIQTYNLPIKIFVLNNQGYHSIRQTQNNFFGEPLIGCCQGQDINFPDMSKIAFAYNYTFFRVHNHIDLSETIRRVLSEPNAVICEVMLTTEQPFAPKPSSVRLPDGRIISRPLEDQAPFLDREEFRQNMIIETLNE